MQRILIIISILVVVIGLVLGVYFLFFSGNDSSLVVGNPFEGLEGDDAAFNNDSAPPPGTEIQGAGTEVAPRLFRITENPTVPQTVAFPITIPIDAPSTQIGTSTTSTTPQTKQDTEIRYIERASGNVYSFVVHERTLTRLSNRTLPGIQEASWTANGSQAFVRFISDQSGTEVVDSYALPANGVGGYFLETGLDTIKAFGNSTLFTLSASAAGSVGTVALPDGTNSRTLFSSSLSAINYHLASSTHVAVTKGSASMDGYAFLVSPTNGAFNRILGPLRGLSALPSRSGDQVLYSYVSQGTIRMGIIDRVSRNTTALPVATLSEKCAWSQDETSIYCAIPTALRGNLPDEWYQGVISFSDRLWRIDLAGRVAVLVVDPQEVADISIDAIGLNVDPQSDTLTFVNRIDGSLWTYDL